MLCYFLVKTNRTVFIPKKNKLLLKNITNNNIFLFSWIY